MPRCLALSVPYILQGFLTLLKPRCILVPVRSLLLAQSGNGRGGHEVFQRGGLVAGAHVPKSAVRACHLTLKRRPRDVIASFGEILLDHGRYLFTCRGSFAQKPCRAPANKSDLTVAVGLRPQLRRGRRATRRRPLVAKSLGELCAQPVARDMLVSPTFCLLVASWVQ